MIFIYKIAPKFIVCNFATILSRGDELSTGHKNGIHCALLYSSGIYYPRYQSPLDQQWL